MEIRIFKEDGVYSLPLEMVANHKVSSVMEDIEDTNVDTTILYDTIMSDEEEAIAYLMSTDIEEWLEEMELVDSTQTHNEEWFWEEEKYFNVKYD